MTVIKHDKAAEVMPRAMVLDLSDLAGQARTMLEQARADAKRIRADAEHEAQQRRAAASDEGYAAGFEKGKTEGYTAGEQAAREDVHASFQPQLEQLTAAWNDALEQWDQSRRDMLLEAREDVLTFAFDLATKVISRTIEHAPTVIQDQLAAALSLLNQPTAATIVVHPEDQPLVEQVLPQLLERLTRCEHAELRADESIGRGGCIVRTAGGSVDATIDTQLTRLAEALLPVDQTPAINDQESNPV